MNEHDVKILGASEAKVKKGVTVKGTKIISSHKEGGNIIILDNRSQTQTPKIEITHDEGDRSD